MNIFMFAVNFEPLAKASIAHHLLLYKCDEPVVADTNVWWVDFDMENTTDKKYTEDQSNFLITVIIILIC